MSIINKPKTQKTKQSVSRCRLRQEEKHPVSAEMVSVKEAAMEMLKSQPDDITWEQLTYNFALRCRVEQGLKDIEEGNYITEEEMNAKWDTWEREHLTPGEIEELDRWEREELKSFG
jgi:hypothetical protein